MKLKYLFSALIISVVISACDFNVNDSPGPQMSSSVKEAKLHGTFICAYKLKNDTLHGIKIRAIFAEKQFWREEGLLLKKKINCCESQLVIVTNNSFTSENGYDLNWKIAGFDYPGNAIIYRNYKGTVFPDSISIKVVAINGKDSTQLLRRVTIYKMKNK